MILEIDNVLLFYYCFIEVVHLIGLKLALNWQIKP